MKCYELELLSVAVISKICFLTERNFLRPTEIQTDVVTWARLLRQAAPPISVTGDTLSPMPLQSDSSTRGQEKNEKPNIRRYSLSDAHGSDAPLSPTKSRPIVQTHSLPKVLNGDDIPFESRRISRASLYKDQTIENELSDSNIQDYLDTGRRQSSGPLKMDMNDYLTPEKMLSDNPEFNVDPDVIIPPPPDFSGDARDYSSGELEMTNHIGHQNSLPSDQYRLEDLDVSADEVDLRFSSSIMSTTHFGNSIYTQPPPSIGASLIDDVKVYTYYMWCIFTHYEQLSFWMLLKLSPLELDLFCL